MTELPARLARQIEKILKLSEKAQTTDPNSADVMSSEEMQSDEDEVSSLILHRLAAEGSGARIQGVNDFEISDGSSVNAVTLSAGGVSSSRRVHRNAPLTSQEKDELLYILQQSDPTLSMDELEYILEGISTGRITDISYGSLRKVIDTAKRAGLTPITEGVPPASPASVNQAKTDLPEKELREKELPEADLSATDTGKSELQDDAPLDFAAEIDASDQEPTVGSLPDSASTVTPSIIDMDARDCTECDATQSAVEQAEEVVAPVQTIINDARHIIRKVNTHIGEYRLSPMYLLDAATVKVRQEMILMEAIRKETQVQAEKDEAQFIEAKFKQKRDTQDQMLAENDAAQARSRSMRNRALSEAGKTSNPETV